MFHKIISRGPVSGEYQAFPDSCRLLNGDIAVVFYAGYAHISAPNETYPRGGRICLTISPDEGRTWTEPGVLYDDEFDNRDPHIAQLSNGTLVCSFFSIRPRATSVSGYEAMGVQLVRSFDLGATWEQTAETLQTNTLGWACSAPVRELPDGTCLLPIYHSADNKAWGGVVRSQDFGMTWSREIAIGAESDLVLPAETDIIQRSDGSLYAALRGDQGKAMHFSTSANAGFTWEPVKNIGFEAHAPHFNRLSSGEILMVCRGINTDGAIVQTALYVSRDECRSWLGPYTIDDVTGAYPSTIELRDGSVLAIYYEEGPGSAVRAKRFLLPSDIQFIPFD